MKMTNKKALVKFVYDYDNLMVSPIFIENQGYSNKEVFQSRISELFGQDRLLLGDIALQINELFESDFTTVSSVVAIMEYTDDDELGVTPVAVRQISAKVLEQIIDVAWILEGQSENDHD
jgi:hypothetical protein